MSRLPHHSARAVALKVLQQYNSRRGDTAELLHTELKTTDRSAQTTDLVYGVIRNSVLLDRLLKVCANASKSKVKPILWTILRLGVYELVFAPKTADYAILNEAVNLTHAVSSPKSAGFVNAVLRNVQRQIAIRDGDPKTAAPTHTVLRADGSGCLFKMPVLPNPSENPAAFLSTGWSLPQWLVSQWLMEYGPDETPAICQASNRQPSVYAWPNSRRITAAALAERLTSEGVTCRLWEERGTVQLSGGLIPGLKSFQEGLFYVQDPAAESAAAFLDPKPGETLIDLCAAPGGKTIALALKMQDHGCIIASDASDVRLVRLEDNIKRLGLTCVRSVAKSELATFVKSLNRVDSVIADVPCSNTGVLARRVEARHRLERRYDKTLLNVQQDLLETAYRLLKPGGRLLYSTCSILQAENEQQIQHFLGKFPDVILVAQQKTLPSTGNADLFDHDGGFLALMART